MKTEGLTVEEAKAAIEKGYVVETRSSEQYRKRRLTDHKWPFDIRIPRLNDGLSTWRGGDGSFLNEHHTPFRIVGVAEPIEVDFAEAAAAYKRGERITCAGWDYHLFQEEGKHLLQYIGKTNKRSTTAPSFHYSYAYLIIPKPLPPAAPATKPFMPPKLEAMNKEIADASCTPTLYGKLNDLVVELLKEVDQRIAAAKEVK